MQGRHPPVLAHQPPGRHRPKARRRRQTLDPGRFRHRDTAIQACATARREGRSRRRPSLDCEKDPLGGEHAGHPESRRSRSVRCAAGSLLKWPCSRGPPKDRLVGHGHKSEAASPRRHSRRRRESAPGGRIQNTFRYPSTGCAWRQHQYGAYGRKARCFYGYARRAGSLRNQLRRTRRVKRAFLRGVGRSFQRERASFVCGRSRSFSGYSETRLI